MKCAEFEERIAFYAGGDLAADQRPAVEEHLRVCSGCAALARELEEDRAWLASRPPETAEADFAAVRREIRRKIERPRWIWKWIAAAAAVLLVCAVVVNVRRAPVKERPLPPVAAQKEVAAVIAAPRPKEAVVRSRVRRPVRKVALGEPAPQVEIRIATRNPNVTIILLHETREVLQ